MAWETRKRGGRYYTRSQRVNGRVVREYVGCGEHAEMAAETDAQQRAVREEQRQKWNAEKANFEQLEELVESLDAGCTSVMRSVLYAAGYHQHNRGEWRKRRRLGNESEETDDA